MAGVEAMKSGASTAAAQRVDWVQRFISAIPHFAPVWSDRLTFGLEWFIFGQPWLLKTRKCAEKRPAARNQ
jgi:hypothetical protein